MPEREADNYHFDVYDITKVWPHSDYPLQEFGKLILNRNPTNYFAEVEQVAFSPSHFVPGIEPSMDKMLQGRLFSYPDTQRHRLGANYQQLPINCPYRARVQNAQRDGFAVVNNNFGSCPNYEPCSTPGNVIPNPKFTPSECPVSGLMARYQYEHPNDNYEQPRGLWQKVFSEDDRKHFILNLSDPLSQANKNIQIKMLSHWFKVDKDLGNRLGKALRMD